MYLSTILKYFTWVYTFTPLHLLDDLNYFADSDYSVLTVYYFWHVARDTRKTMESWLQNKQKQCIFT